jgi:hypothetical protein
VSEFIVKVKMSVGCRFRESFIGLNWGWRDVHCIEGGLKLRLLTNTKLL